MMFPEISTINNFLYLVFLFFNYNHSVPGPGFMSAFFIFKSILEFLVSESLMILSKVNCLI